MDFALSPAQQQVQALAPLLTDGRRAVRLAATWRGQRRQHFDRRQAHHRLGMLQRGRDHLSCRRSRIARHLGEQRGLAQRRQIGARQLRVQGLRRPCLPGTRLLQGAGIAAVARRRLAEPVLELEGDLPSILVNMATQAGIAMPKLQGLGGVGHAEAVVVAQVVAHVVAAGHVATGALRARRALRMAMVRGRARRPSRSATARCMRAAAGKAGEMSG